jgi:aryl-alcohol dehydrogenase-like predicted oxidoreductase
VEYRRLGWTDLRVSAIALGTMTWGEQNTEAQAHEQIALALEHGVNFLDTAEMYPVPPRAETYSRTEKFIGNWIQRSGGRDKLVIATKAAGPARAAPRPSHVRDGKTHFDRKSLTDALNGSLDRLRTDYIDLYQLHWPDRSTNTFGQLGYQHVDGEFTVPIEETLEVLAGFVKEGKVRYIGVSNETPWGVAQFLKLAEAKGLPRIVSIQNPYSLLNRTYEIGLSEFSHREQLSLLVYSPLAFGLLSGKYLAGARPAAARLTLFDRFVRYLSGNAESATYEYVRVFRRHGLDPAQAALAFVNSRPFVTSSIIGATTIEQLRSNLASIDIRLSPELLAEIDEIHGRIPNPAP